MRLKKFLQKILPWIGEPVDPKVRQRAKAYMLGAGAGSSIKPDKDGKIRIGKVKDEDT